MEFEFAERLEEARPKGRAEKRREGENALHGNLTRRLPRGARARPASGKRVAMATVSGL